MKTNKQERLEFGEVLEELRYRVINSTDKSNNKTKFANSTSEELLEQLKSYQKLIYGADDRRDLYAVSDPDIKKLADSVVSLIRNNRISDNGNGTSTILTQSYADEYNLCRRENFRDQPIAPFCSGFLVAPNIVATAGHCVDRTNLPTVNFVFGFRMIDSSRANVVIPNQDIYRGTEIIAWELDQRAADYALVRLDRPVSDHSILPVRRTGKINDGEEIFVIGHPSGLPLKYAAGAKVNRNSASSFFEATLDTYGGNSGSPVFNKDGIVEGILVRGEQDYKYDSSNSCFVSNQVDNYGITGNGLIGEDVTRTTEFASFIEDSEDKVITNSELDISKSVDNLENLMESIAKDIKHIKNNI